MRGDLEAGPPLDLLRDPLHPAVLEIPRPSTARADEVVMVGGFAADVGMFAGWQIEPLESLQLREQVERAEYRRPADPDAPLPCVLDQVRGREVPFLSGDQIGHAAPGVGESVAGTVERADERVGSCHAPHDTEYQSATRPRPALAEAWSPGRPAADVARPRRRR